MSHDDREEVEQYIKHSKQIKNHMAKEMLKVFDVEYLLDAVIWKLMCDTHDNKDVARENRKEHIQGIVDKVIDKWM